MKYYELVILIFRKTCMIPTIEGTKYFNKNGKQNVSLPHGTAVEQYTIVEEDCEDRYYKVIPERFMVCSESGQWRPFVTEELCLSKYLVYLLYSINLAIVL